MILDINKNFNDMNKSFLTGRKKYQMAALIAAFVVSVLIMVVLSMYISANIASYIILFICIPLGFIGIFEKNGMDFLTYMRKKKSNATNGKLTIRSTMTMTSENEVREEKIDLITKLVRKAMKKNG